MLFLVLSEFHNVFFEAFRHFGISMIFAANGSQTIEFRLGEWIEQPDAP